MLCCPGRRAHEARYRYVAWSVPSVVACGAAVSSLEPRVSRLPSPARPRARGRAACGHGAHARGSSVRWSIGIWVSVVYFSIDF